MAEERKEFAPFNTYFADFTFIYLTNSTGLNLFTSSKLFFSKLTTCLSHRSYSDSSLPL